MPLVSPTGVLLAMKGSSIAAEIDEHAPTWQRLGCAAPEVVANDVSDPIEAAIQSVPGLEQTSSTSNTN